MRCILLPNGAIERQTGPDAVHKHRHVLRCCAHSRYTKIVKNNISASCHCPTKAKRTRNEKFADAKVMKYSELKRHLSSLGVQFGRGRGSYLKAFLDESSTVFPYHASKEIPPELTAKILLDLGVKQADLISEAKKAYEIKRVDKLRRAAKL